MKLIVDISERDHKNISRIVDMGFGTNVDESIKNGIPLDDVKAEIMKLEMEDCVDLVYRHEVIDILDNIGRKDGE